MKRQSNAPGILFAKLFMPTYFLNAWKRRKNIVIKFDKARIISPGKLFNFFKHPVNAVKLADGAGVFNAAIHFIPLMLKAVSTAERTAPRRHNRALVAVKKFGVVINQTAIQERQIVKIGFPAAHEFRIKFIVHHSDAFTTALTENSERRFRSWRRH